MTAYDLSHIQGIIWDLDGTLYRYDQIFVEACHLGAARTAIDLGLQMDIDEAYALAVRSYKEHGSSFRFCLDYGIKYEELHLPFHAAVDTTILSKNREMKEGLEALKMPMVILTNASRDWARRTLDHLEYGHIFGDRNILSLEDVNYQSKSQSKAGFEKALSVLSVPAENTLMVEDLAHNLLKAKEMGMTTALVHHQKLPDSGLQHVDVLFEDTLELVRSFIKQ
jgi:putative hydrolase of the HAD superfamily